MDKLSWKNLTIIGFLLACLILIWIGRFEMIATIPGGESAYTGDVYVLDRWTGSVIQLRVGEANAVVKAK